MSNEFDEVTGAGVEPIVEPSVEPIVEPTEPIVEPVVEPVEPIVAEPVEPVEPVEPTEPIEPAVEEPESDLAILQARNKVLLEALDTASSGLAKPAAKPTEPKSAVAEPEPVAPKVPTPTQFVTSEEFEEVLTDAGKFNTLLNKVYSLGQSSVQGVREEVLTGIPSMVNKLVSEQSRLQGLVQDFYNKNNDLLQYRSYVGVVANELQGQHPEWEVAKLFEETEGEVRKRLKVIKAAPKEEGIKKPSFANPPKSRKPASAVSPTQQEINEMIN